MNEKNKFDKALPYIITIIIGLMGFLSRQVYASLNSKPSEAEVKVLIEEYTKPLTEGISKNTNKISAFQVTLNNLASVATASNAMLIRIDDRTIELGKDVSEIKGKVNQMD